MAETLYFKFLLGGGIVFDHSVILLTTVLHFLYHIKKTKTAMSKIKEAVYSGVGFVALAGDKVQEISSLWKEKEVSTEEGKKIVDEFWKDAETKREMFEGRVNKVLSQVTSKFNFLNSKEVDDLQTRIEKLEAKVAQFSKGETTAAKKATKATTK